jgi:hypothetical protein
MKRLATLGCVTATILASAPTAAADGSKASTFSGSCSFHALVRFQPPLTNTPQQGQGSATGPGTCDGTLTDKRGRTRQLSGEPAEWVAADSGLVSCSEESATGGGYIAIAGRKLRFRLTETRASGAAELHLDGSAGGSADGTATLSSQEDPVQIAQACAGSGLAQALVDIQIQTTPSISG